MVSRFGELGSLARSHLRLGGQWDFHAWHPGHGPGWRHSTQRTGEGHSRSVWNIGVPQTLHAPVFVPAITPISGCQSLPVQRETDTEMFRWPFTTAVSSQSLPLHMP